MTTVEAHAKYTAHSSFADLSTKCFTHGRWLPQDVFGDLRVRSGIKFGLAALLVSGRHTLPEFMQAVLRPRLERLEVEFNQMLDAFAECVREGDCRRVLPSLNGALSEMEEAAERIRKSEISKHHCLEPSSVRVIEMVDHYHATAEALEECRRLVGALKIHRHWGHCGL